MENIRRQIAANTNFYSPDVISIGSSDSSSAPPVNRTNPRPIIVVSDSDSDDDEVIKPLQPRVPSGQKPKPTQTAPKEAILIPIPSNGDIHPRARPQAAVADRDAVNIDANDAWEAPKAAGEVEKELKELFSGAPVDHQVEFTEEDMVVDGFNSDFRLLPHQVQARHWMKDREGGNKYGGILADDMGLGKTIQTLVRIVEGKPHRADREKGYAPGTLVIAPTSLATQWEEEIKRLAPSLRVLIHTGANRTNNPEFLAKYHVVITSYGTVASEHSDSPRKKKVLNALFKVKWWRIVLDEAHTIKNRTTKNAKACFDLDAKNRWCLTGTPIQNKVEEFYSLINFLRMKPLNDWPTFKEAIVDPLKRGKTKAPMKRLHAMLKFIMLRRTKDDTINGKKILDLPPKVIEIVHCDFSPAERHFYDSIETRMKGELEKLAQIKDHRSYMHMLTLLLRARQACDHPSLVTGEWKQDQDAVINKLDNNSQEDEDGAELAKALENLDLGTQTQCQICFKQLESPSDTYCAVCSTLTEKIVDTSKTDSAKIRKVIELVDEIEKRSEQTEKIIIFSQFTSMLALVHQVLEDKEINHVQYDGTMNQALRQKVITTIKEDPETRVILMSFKAGGVGLNLTACNNVILIDLWWNPALEDQAFGRAHRIGQKKQVNIWKLTIENTVEDRILGLQERKRILAESALSGEAMSKVATLGRDELMALFKRGMKEDD